jgi:transposase InsO family protein
MSRRGNPYDNAKAESFMKTLKVEAIYPMVYETFNDVVADLTSSMRSIISVDCIALSATLAHSSSRTNTPGRRSNQQPIPSSLRGPLHLSMCDSFSREN